MRGRSDTRGCDFLKIKLQKIAISTNLSVDSKRRKGSLHRSLTWTAEEFNQQPRSWRCQMITNKEQSRRKPIPGSSERRCDSERKSRILLSSELFSDASQEDVDVSVFNHLNNAALWSQAVFKALSSADAVKTFIQLGIKTTFYICYPAGWKVPACPPPPSLPFFPRCG